MTHFYPDRDPMLSRPVKVHWAGWESDTLKLQSAGWEISAREDIAYQRLQLAIRHEGFRMHGLSNHTEFPYMRRDVFVGVNGSYLDHLTLPINHMASHMMVQVPVDSGAVFQPVDCMPIWRGPELKGLAEFAHFAGARAGQELIVPEEDVNDLLSRILEVQQKARTDYFMDRVKRAERGAESGLSLDAVPERKFAAQIISLAERRMAA
jgi:hypothetical protein